MKIYPKQRTALPLAAAALFILTAHLEAFAVPTWTAHKPNPSPPIRDGAQIAYDAATNRVIAFLPGNPAVPPNLSSEVWVLRHANGMGGTMFWTKLNPTGTAPSLIMGGSVAYDPTTNKLIVYGGCYANCSPSQSQVFVLTNANGSGGTPAWSQLSVTNPQDRVFHSTVYDAVNNLLISFGGQHAFFGTDENDTRVLSNANGAASPSTWSTLATAGGPPPARGSHTIVYDSANNRLILYAGSNGISCCYNIVPFGDVWVLSNANGIGGTPTWSQLLPTGTPPPARDLHTAVYLPAKNKMYVFGGQTWSNATQSATLRGERHRARRRDSAPDGRRVRHEPARP
ncbi:MAG TPA: hypothetical protein VD968_10995, partial [Pyrinomonadaceae bacterium]|nr:hypothetical protein [Pyrinomonadaceae bacterium]